MKEHLLQYLANEKLFSVAAIFIGLMSIAISIYFWLSSPHTQSKSFAITMLVIGIIEFGVFTVSYLTADRRAAEKVATFEMGLDTSISLEKARVDRVLVAFFILKLFYAVLFVTSILLLSKVNVSSSLSGILIALLLQCGFAAAIDSFGEQYTKTFSHQLKNVR